MTTRILSMLIVEFIGLRIVSNPTSSNLTPRKTISQDSTDMGLDGACLSCPGSSVVAEADDSDS